MGLGCQLGCVRVPNGWEIVAGSSLVGEILKIPPSSIHDPLETGNLAPSYGVHVWHLQFCGEE